MWTSVPQTSEYKVRRRTEPSSSAGSANSRTSTGTRGAGMTAARTDIGARAALRMPMPLLENEGRGCGHPFEYLTREGRTPACPSCHGDNLQKLLSVFAVGAEGGRKGFEMPASTGACGHCGDPRGPARC